LVAVGVALSVRLGRGSGGDRGGGPLPAGPLLLALLGGLLTAAAAEPCQVESAYFCARVVDDLPPCEGRTLFLDRLRHSCVHLDDPTALDFSYTQILGDVLATIAPEGQPIAALHIGGGGFTLPRYIAATRPGSDSLVLELDPGLVQVAQDELGLRLSDRLRVRTGDARLGLRKAATRRYDVVIGDAFGGQAVPWHLATREFTREIRDTLTPGGTYAINLIDYPPLGFARAEAATLRSVFDHVAVIAPRARLQRRQGGNFVLVASDAPIDVRAIAARNRRRGDDDAVATGRRLDAFIGEAPVLTDDYAPVDQLLTPAT
ncbi:MAG: fused MFS/spermidine synthase, partial [Euzebyales bacterium]|nr:fused MFS/spermidine synthase [Euzebyales bacterium]